MVSFSLPQPDFFPTPIPDVVIIGAGVIGLAIALELNIRGMQVTVLERDTALSHASTAAAGMLAADDPHNPGTLHSLSKLSVLQYPSFLLRVEQLSGFHVPFQTETTLQYKADGTSTAIDEHSLDPRQLASALLKAVRTTSVRLLENVNASHVEQTKAHGSTLVYASGAWPTGSRAVLPRKGQMLRVRIPATLDLDVVHRAEHVYVVPRTRGPQAGSALIGATVEDAGYDVQTSPVDLAQLRRDASRLVSLLGSESEAPIVECWAGIRPATADSLPLIGPVKTLSSGSRQFIATGHFRNGLLLAPATAVVVADLVEGKLPAVDIAPFLPDRFA